MGNIPYGQQVVYTTLWFSHLRLWKRRENTIPRTVQSVNIPIHTAHWAEASEADEIYAEAESENPHGDAGGEHGEFYVTGGSEAVGRDEGHYPYDWFDDCDPGYHVEAHLGALGFHST